MSAQKDNSKPITMDDWYKCPLDRKVLKELTRRNDRDALLYLSGFLAMVAGSGVLAWLSLGTWWCVPAFLLYGTIYAFAEAMEHELRHRTPFRSEWLNASVHWLICFMTWREQIYSRWSHAQHHTYTHLTATVPADVEIAVKRPPNYLKLATDFLRVSHGIHHLGNIVLHSLGIVSRSAKAVVPPIEYRAMCRNSRIVLALYVGVVAWAIVAHSWLPAVFLLLPRAYGAWLHELLAITQHTGLRENELDHRFSTRTIRLNPVLQLLYWNMNYHVEHHMFPNVPFHALPKLRKAIEADLPPAYDGLFSAWSEIVYFLRMQRHDPDYMITPRVPGKTPATQARPSDDEALVAQPR
ncbi:MULTISPECIES: fatty acid desaturase [Paraburkholderia]|uniref:fatty acid desaturase n=1 Tax=Paraburkholderia TaxID=1822464 RepID=UPI000B345781|nr:fatty acid desaturase [Paraburkholderia hospita]AXF04260.1 oxidative enzyme [Paraburkholderia hospita]OUL86929.1 oxidative enzyme [Paraburkholderia hospita]